MSTASTGSFSESSTRKSVRSTASSVVRAFKKKSGAASQRRRLSERMWQPPPNPENWAGATKLVVDCGDTVISVALSEACTMFAAGGTNMLATVFSTQGGAKICAFKAKAVINAVAFCGGVCGQNCDSRLLVAGTFGGRINVWSIGTRMEECEEPFTEAGGEAVLSLAVADSGRRLVAGGQASSVVVFAIERDEEVVATSTAAGGAAGVVGLPTVRLARLLSFKVSGSVLSLALSADGALLATGGESRVVQLWALHGPDCDSDGEASLSKKKKKGSPNARMAHERARMVHQFGCRSVVHSVSLTASGDMLAVGTSEHTEVYQIADALAGPEHAEGGRAARAVEPLICFECPAHQGGVALARESKMLAVGGNETVTLFNPSSGATMRTMPRDGRVRCVALSDDGGILVAGGFDKQATLHHTGEGARLYRVYEHPEAVVRSIDLSEDGSRIALGTERGGKGQVLVYDGGKGQALMHVIDMPKAVWTARLSPGGALLAVAGFDCRLSVYDTRSAQLLKQVAYTSTRGPAFIWSCEWSGDGSFLALGCWNGEAYLYRMNREALAHRRWKSCARVSTSEQGTEGAGAGAGSADGKGEVEDLFEQVAAVTRTDRVYAVALDHNAGHLVVGGRDKRVAMFSTADKGARRAEPVLLWEALSEDFVYCLALADDLSHVAFGGTSKAVAVLDGLTGRPRFRIAAPGTVWAVALLEERGAATKLAYGGECAALTVVDLHSRSEELQLPVNEPIYSVALTGESLCFAAGGTGTLFGKGKVEYSWRDQPSYDVLTTLIDAMAGTEDQLMHCITLIVQRHPAIVNARSSADGTSLLQFIVERRGNLSQVLERLLHGTLCRTGLEADRLGAHALLSGGFTLTPATMQLVAQCFESLAVQYPLDFLHFIANLPLQPEPEIISSSSAQDVVLSHRLVRGSTRRCPQGMWDEKLAQFRRAGHDPRLDAGFGVDEVFGVGEADGSLEESTAQRKTARRGSAVNEALVGSCRRIKTFASRVRGHSDSRAQLDPSSPSRSRAKEVPEGYCTTSRGSVHALRVPIENFAGYLSSASGARFSVLQLVVDAVSTTSKYDVFGSVPMEILLEFKWRGFALRSFVKDLLVNVVHMVVAVTFNLAVSAEIGIDARDALGLNGKRPYVFLLFGWCWTTVACFAFGWIELKQLKAGGLAYFSEWANQLDLVYVFSQLVVNVLFWLPYDSLFSTGEATLDAPSPPPLAPDGARRFLKAGGGAGEASAADLAMMTAGSTKIGVFATVQAIVVFVLFLRMLSFFRGFLAFGALVHMVKQIFVDMLPFMVLLFLVTAGFSCMLSVLMQHSMFASDITPWTPWYSLFVSINMGLYATYDPMPMEKEWQVVLTFELFMICVQIVLLNLLIAIMANSHNRVHAVAQLVAHFERAKLVLDYEQTHGIGLFDSKRLAHVLESPGHAARWLHVLEPVERMDDGAERSVQLDTQAELEALRLQLAAQAQGTAKLHEDVRASLEASERRGAALEASVEAIAAELTGVRPRPAALVPARLPAAAPKARPKTEKAASDVASGLLSGRFFGGLIGGGSQSSGALEA